MRSGGARWEGVKLTEEEDLCRLLTLFDDFFGCQETQVDLSGNPGCFFLLADALTPLLLSLLGRGHEGRDKGVIIVPVVVGDGFHGEGEGGLPADGNEGGERGLCGS